MSRPNIGDNWANRDETITKDCSFDPYADEAFALDTPVVSELRTAILD